MSVEVEEQDLFPASGTVIVDFWAPWCAPCRALAPLLSSVADDYPDITLAKVDVQEHAAAGQKYQIRAIPCLVVFQDGEEVERSVGMKGEAQLRELFSRYSQDVS